MTCCRALFSLLLLLFALPANKGIAQTPNGRLHGAVRSGTRSALVGSAPPQVRHAADLGAVPAEYPLRGITLVLNRTPEQQAALEHLLAAQQDPASPDFHRWLTPDEFAARFGTPESDLQAVERWLTGQGFTRISRSRAQDRITFAGTAGQAATAFGSPLHRFLVEGETHVAPAADFTLPSDLAAVTAAVLHLSDFRPHPQFHATLQPAFTSEATQAHYLTPADLRTLYDMPPDIDQTSYNAVNAGAGQSVAIVGQSYVDLSYGGKLREFDQSRITRTYNEVLVPGTGSEAISPGDQAESEIDLEYASGSAPFANYLLVHVGSDPHYSVFDALAFAIDQNLAPVISVSYGVCEFFVSATEAAQGTALFQQAATQGQTIVAASGDSGSTACARHAVSSDLPEAQQQALAVDYPADSPYVTAVGGAQLMPGTFSAGDTTYWAPAPPMGYDVFASLLSYVPEIAWNEGSATQGIAASGGGVSTLFPRPAWQAGVPGMPPGATRVVPDVALQASGANPGFLFCTDDAAVLASEGLKEGEGCNFLITVAPHYVIGGGTSFAAPVFAAMTATVNQYRQALGSGNLNPSLYQLAGGSSAASVFHDITTGSNACVAGAARCGAAGQTGYSAGVGYDEVTGLGSIDLLHLIAALPNSAPGTQQTITSIQLFEATLNPGDTEPLTIEVGTDLTAPHPITPTGTISLALDGVVVNPALALSAPQTGDYIIGTVYTYTAPATPGSHTVTATYAGDANHGASTTTNAILVGNVLASGTIALGVGNLSLPANGSGTTNVTITPGDGYNGRLFWSLAITASSNNSALTGCYSIPTIAVDAPSSAVLSLGVGTACSAALPAGNAQFRPMVGLRAGKARESHPDGSDGAGDPGRTRPATIVASLLLLGLWPLARRRSLAVLGLVLILSAGTWTLAGCGGGGSSNPVVSQPPPPQAVTYTLSLTGTDSVKAKLQASATFTLTVQ